MNRTLNKSNFSNYFECLCKTQVLWSQGLSDYRRDLDPRGKILHHYQILWYLIDCCDLPEEYLKWHHSFRRQLEEAVEDGVPDDLAAALAKGKVIYWRGEWLDTPVRVRNALNAIRTGQNFLYG